NGLRYPAVDSTRYLKTKVLRRFISRVNPTLTSHHKLQRLAWALAQVKRPIGKKFDFCIALMICMMLFIWMKNGLTCTRHLLDAIWRLMNLYFTDRDIGEVVFLAAKNHLVENWNMPYDRAHQGKEEFQKSTRRSTNHKKVYVQMLKENIFPAIREKW
ncbi:hypothetical protein GN958_ATG04783, partial [Phytophthora infestans]